MTFRCDQSLRSSMVRLASAHSIKQSLLSTFLLCSLLITHVTATGTTHQEGKELLDRCIFVDENHGVSDDPHLVCGDPEASHSRLDKYHSKRKRFSVSTSGMKHKCLMIEDGLKDHWWEEDEMQDGGVTKALSSVSSENLDETQGSSFNLRNRWWRRRRNFKRDEIAGPLDSSTPTSPGANAEKVLRGYKEEHPMRTDEWELNIKVSRMFPPSEASWFTGCSIDRNSNTLPSNQRSNVYRRKQVMQFATNGFVKVLEGDRAIDFSNNSSVGRQGMKLKSKVGKWRIGHSGVAFDVPVELTLRAADEREKGQNGAIHSKVIVLRYHADIHLNKFGERPRMFRGVVTRDRHSTLLPCNFLRPVIATFSAKGIGEDTADTSYRERGFGLSRQTLPSTKTSP